MTAPIPTPEMIAVAEKLAWELKPVLDQAKDIAQALAAERALTIAYVQAKYDALADSAYLAGASAGWQIGYDDGLSGDVSERLVKLHESRVGYLKVLRTPAGATETSDG